MSDPPVARQVAGRADEVATDLPCARCGYNLRGLWANHNCPECGTRIELSLQGNLLRFADPEWLKKLRLGIALKLWQLLIIAILVGVGILAAFVGMFAVSAFGLIGSVVGIVATWMITAPEPNIAVEEDPMTLRRMIRVCVVISVFGEQMQQLTTGVRTPFGAGPMPGVVPTIMVTAAGLLGVVAMIGEFIYLRRFARRFPDQRLADNTTVVMWGLSGTLTAALIIGLFSAFVLVPVAAGAAVGGGPVVVTTGGAGADTADASTAATQPEGDSELSPPTSDGSAAEPEAPDDDGADPDAARVSKSGAATTTTLTTVTAAGTPPTWAIGVLLVFGCAFAFGLLVFGIWNIVLLFQYYGGLGNVLAEARQLAETGDASRD